MASEKRTWVDAEKLIAKPKPPPPALVYSTQDTSGSLQGTCVPTQCATTDGPPRYQIVSVACNIAADALH